MSTVALNERFAFLDDDRLRNLKPNSASRERGLVVDVTFSEAPSSGIIDVDFTGLSQFTEVYSCKIVQTNLSSPVPLTGVAVLFNYVPGTGAVGEFEVIDVDDGLASAQTITGTVTVEIRGI